MLSLALNLPGPAALLRLRAMGAACTKVEPPGGDPMGHYNPGAYAQLHEGVRVIGTDLKTERGQDRLHRELARSDLLPTSFRPSALDKLGLGWKHLHRLYPALSVVAIVGAPGARAEEPGHDLTYLAEAGLVAGVEGADLRSLFQPQTHAAIAAFLRGRTRQQLERLAVAQDIPLHTLPA